MISPLVAGGSGSGKSTVAREIVRRDGAERGRSVESVLDPYETTVRPMHRDFVEPSQRWANIILPEGGHSTVAVVMLATKMASILAET